MSVVDDYFEQLDRDLGEVRDRNAETLAKVAEAAATAMRSGGKLRLHDTGHMVSHELVYRTGGLPAFVKYDPAAGAQQEDLLFVVSVSGTSESVVEVAKGARGNGTTVVALTSVQFSSSLQPKHPDGIRLFEAADLVLDNCAPVGDAALAVAGVQEPLAPLSGIANAALMWAVTAATAQALAESGRDPSIYPSINLPDGPARVKAVEQRYAEKGF